MKQKLAGLVMVLLSIAFLVYVGDEDAAAGVLYLLLGLYLLFTDKKVLF